MQNEYKKTIKSMILANESLKEQILEDFRIEEEDNKIINIELFYLTFSLFSDYFKRLDIYDSWKELLGSHDYYIDGDRVISGGKEISFQLLEMTFIETLLKYREKRDKKIVNVTNFRKVKMSSESMTEEDNSEVEVLYNIGHGELIQFVNDGVVNDERDSKREEAIKVLSSYQIGNSECVKSYLYEIRDGFRNIVYDCIVSLYNRLKKGRKDKMFKSVIPLINESSKDSRQHSELAHLLLTMYPIQFYGKDKDCIDYSKLLIPNIEVDANHYRYDDVWEEFEKKYEEINKIIDNCMIFIRSRKVKESEKRRIRFKINQLEWEKRDLESKYMLDMIEKTDMREIIDEETDESYYSGSMLNKHILYNLEIALKNGHVDIINKKGRDVLVLYAIVDKQVDFILEIDSSKFLDIIDMDSILSSFGDGDYQKRMSGNE